MVTGSSNGTRSPPLLGSVSDVFETCLPSTVSTASQVAPAGIPPSARSTVSQAWPF